MDGRELAIKINSMIESGRAASIFDALRQIGEITGERPGSLYQRMWRAGVSRETRLRIPKEE